MFIVVWIICGIVTGVIASAKGRSGFGWLIIGMLLGIFGVILIACMPSLRAQTVAFAAPALAVDDRPTKNCSECGETVLAVANVCKHCGHRFDGIKSVTAR
jgi:Zn finger protein HypA/HybF involved in hydrogenase expression